MYHSLFAYFHLGIPKRPKGIDSTVETVDLYMLMLMFSLASTMTHIPVKIQTIQASSHMIKYQALAVETRVVPGVAWAVVVAAAALLCPAVVVEEDQVLAFFKELLQIW